MPTARWRRPSTPPPFPSARSPGTESAGAGQDDVAATVFLAWGKHERAGRCLDAALAMLAVIASQALHVTGRQGPPALRLFMEELRAIAPPSMPTGSLARSCTSLPRPSPGRLIRGPDADGR